MRFGLYGVLFIILVAGAMQAAAGEQFWQGPSGQPQPSKGGACTASGCNNDYCVVLAAAPYDYGCTYSNAGPGPPAWNIYGGNCPGDQVLVPTGASVPGDPARNGVDSTPLYACGDAPPPCDGDSNPVTGVCDDLCESGLYYAQDDSGAGVTAGQCYEEPDDCISSGGTPRMDGGGNDVPVVNQAGDSTPAPYKMIECFDAPEGDTCNSIGKSNYDDTFDFCQARKDDCDAVGGTYGAIGTPEGGTSHVCINDLGADTPVCASGSQLYYEENPDGSFGVACTPATPDDTVCDAQQYDCDGDGNVDDQDHDGVKDNGTANEHDQGGGGDTSSGGFTGTITDPNDPNYGETIGDNPLDPATEGAGDCDPTSQNYAECIGMPSGGTGTEDIDNNLDQSLINGVDSSGSNILDAMESEVLAGLGDGDAAIPGATGLGNMLTGGVFATTCTDFTYSIFGNNLTLSCAKLSPLRTVLAWVIALWTLFYIFSLANRKPV